MIKKAPLIAHKSGNPKMAWWLQMLCDCKFGVFFGDHVLGYCHLSVGIESGGWKIILEF